MTEDDGAEKLGARDGKQHIPLMNKAESVGQTSVLFCTISKFLKPLNQSNFFFFCGLHDLLFDSVYIMCLFPLNWKSFFDT